MKSVLVVADPVRVADLAPVGYHIPELVTLLVPMILWNYHWKCNLYLMDK